MAIDKINSEGLLLSDDFVFTGSVSGAGGVNTPYFLAYRNGNTTQTNEVDTKIALNAETFDSASAFDSTTNYRWTPQTAGKYWIFGQVYLSHGSNANNKEYSVRLKKNGTTFASNHRDARTSGIGYQQALLTGGLVEFNGSSDYVELFAIGNWTSGDINVIGGANNTYMGGYKIIE